MSCGTCGIEASNTMQADTGVPAGAPQTKQARCPDCGAWAEAGAACSNPRCPSQGRVSGGGRGSPTAYSPRGGRSRAARGGGGRTARPPREPAPKRSVHLSYFSNREAQSAALDRAGFNIAERDTLLRIHDRLPHGSGLDSNWSFEVAGVPGRGKVVRAYTTFSAMNEVGMYCHDYSIGVTLHVADWQTGKVTVGRITTGRLYDCCGDYLDEDLAQRFEGAFAEDLPAGAY